jgi:hypothetical protein
MNEPLAMWLEGIALVAIFGLELVEFKRQGRERKEAREESAAQLRIMQSQADAVVNSERAWIVAELVPVCARFADRWHRPAGTSWVPLGEDEILAGYYLLHRLRLTNMGRTSASILECEIQHSYLGEGKPKVLFVPDSVHAIAGNGFIERTEVDIHSMRNDLITEVGDSKKIVEFNGIVRYQHVFSVDKIEAAFFSYIYKPEEGRLRQVQKKSLALIGGAS